MLTILERESLFLTEHVFRPLHSSLNRSIFRRGKLAGQLLPPYDTSKILIIWKAGQSILPPLLGCIALQSRDIFSEYYFHYIFINELVLV